MSSSFNGNPCTTITFCYSSIYDIDEMDITTKYNEQNSIL